MPAKILIIEDDADAREMMRLILSNEGFITVTAEDGLVGLTAAEDHRPDLIITDLNMPKLNGIEVIKELRQHPDLSVVPVLVLSAYRSGALSDAMKAGANGAMQKPISLDDLTRLIKNLLTHPASILLFPFILITAYIA